MQFQITKITQSPRSLLHICNKLVYKKTCNEFLFLILDIPPTISGLGVYACNELAKLSTLGIPLTINGLGVLHAGSHSQITCKIACDELAKS